MNKKELIKLLDKYEIEYEITDNTKEVEEGLRLLDEALEKIGIIIPKETQINNITRENDPEVPKYTTEWTNGSDLISRQAAIEAIEKAYCNPCKERGDDYNGVRCRACNFDDAIIQIDALPPVEPKQSKGEWVYLKDDETHQPEEGLFVVCKCSNCGEQECFLIDSKTKEIHGDNYCCTCGADMRKNIRRR